MSWLAIFGAIGKLLSKIPIQDRKERWKNELDSLKKEREKLLKEKPDAKKANRVCAINERIAIINQWLRNSSNAD